MLDITYTLGPLQVKLEQMKRILLKSYLKVYTANSLKCWSKLQEAESKILKSMKRKSITPSPACCEADVR